MVRETVQRQFSGAQALNGPIELNEQLVVLDARPRFDFSMARVPRSQNFNWVDFSEPEPSQRGWPQRDLFAAARRLARMGIGPDSKVVVLGNGKAARGEEGRVAWFLSYLGVKDVRFGRFDSVKKRVTTEVLPEEIKRSREMGLSAGTLIEDDSFKDGNAKPAEPEIVQVPIWKPEPISSLIVTRNELKGAIESRAVQKAWSFDGRPERLYRIIDVRPEREYLGQSGGLRSKLIPNVDAINIPWKEFFNDSFRPELSLASQIQSVGVRPEHRIIVIDSDGVASSAVTMALRAMGFSQAGVYAGGYNDLMDR